MRTVKNVFKSKRITSKSDFRSFINEHPDMRGYCGDFVPEEGFIPTTHIGSWSISDELCNYYVYIDNMLVNILALEY